MIYINSPNNLPNGNIGDILQHNGNDWVTSNIIEYRNIAWFQANANNVIEKNKIIILDEDRKCFKITDGVTALKNLRWYIDRNYGDISVSGYTGVFGRNTTTGKDITHSVFGQSYVGTSSITISNEFRGSFGIVAEPFQLEALGINVLSHNSSGGSVQLQIGVYQVDFATRTNTLIASTPLSPIVVGANFFNLPSPVFLPSGVYFFAYRYEVPSGSSFQIQYINQFNQVGYIADNNYRNFSYYVEGNKTAMPTTCGFPYLAAGVTYYYLLAGERILKNI